VATKVCSSASYSCITFRTTYVTIAKPGSAFCIHVAILLVAGRSLSLFQPWRAITHRIEFCLSFENVRTDLASPLLHGPSAVHLQSIYICLPCICCNLKLYYVVYTRLIRIDPFRIHQTLPSSIITSSRHDNASDSVRFIIKEVPASIAISHSKI
jgi:hypothetical protein